MLISSKPSVLFVVILILFSISDISSGQWNYDMYQRVLHKLLANKNNFQPSTTTTEKPPATKKISFDKFGQWNTDIYQRVLHKPLAKNLKNNFQPSTTTTEKPPATEKMTFDKFPGSNSYSYHSQKDCLQKCTYKNWIFSLCRCLIHK